jgi:hypothetical protein
MKFASKEFSTKNLFGFLIKSVTTSNVPNTARPEKYSDEVWLHGECGRRIRFYHNQDCCESVSVEDIVGDLDDLVDSMILVADMPSSEDAPSAGESGTWTYYRIMTNKGWVEFRWLGTSNGYYSESVEVEFIDKGGVSDAYR